MAPSDAEVTPSSAARREIHCSRLSRGGGSSAPQIVKAVAVPLAASNLAMRLLRSRTAGFSGMKYDGDRIYAVAHDPDNRLADVQY